MTKSRQLIFSIIIRDFKARNVAIDGGVIGTVNGKIDWESEPQGI